MKQDAILVERGSRYGEFVDNADATQALLAAAQRSKNWDGLPPIMKEAMHMVFHKFARALNGDPLYLDNWVDAGRYCMLVEQWLGVDSGDAGDMPLLTPQSAPVQGVCGPKSDASCGPGTLALSTLTLHYSPEHIAPVLRATFDNGPTTSAILKSPSNVAEVTATLHVLEHVAANGVNSLTPFGTRGPDVPMYPSVRS